MKIRYNAPVVLTYTLISVLVLALGLNDFFTVSGYMDDWSNPINYFQLISHIAGHANWEHLIGNFTLILLIGPILEEKYGSQRLLVMILATGLLTGILNIVLLDTGLLGASGIVFMLIILSSISNAKAGEIPLTFILIALLYIGGEVMRAMGNDNVSQFAHILGGVCGAFFGFVLKGNNGGSKKNKTTELI
ncbi:MAG: rhomboid family intramembrane serine protease [Flammeovirgaceae bacterium]